MPELPEVETVRRSLLPHLKGQQITSVVINRPGQIRHPEPEVFAVELPGAIIEDIERRGKYLIFHLSGGTRMVAHLRMSGRLIVADPGTEVAKHTHVIFGLGGGKELRYQDQRTFGGFHLLGPEGEGMPAGLAELGPEPLSPAFTPEYLAQELARRRTNIKAALLDQSLVAGLGNIYVDESLFRSGLHPTRACGSLTLDEIRRLHEVVQEILADAIQKRGTTFSLYFDGENRQGDYYDELYVFDRKGQPCRRCGTEIHKIRVAGRGTHFCPTCQPEA